MADQKISELATLSPVDNADYVAVVDVSTGETKKATRAEFKGDTGATGATGPQGPAGADGEDAYVYIAYADDASGTGFTTTFNASKDYIAIKSTTAPIASPSASDFAGLWKNYKGATGATGPQGPQGDPGTGSGDVTGPASSVDSEIALFSGTGGKTIKRATGSGFAKLVSGVLSLVASIVESDLLLSDNTTNNASTTKHGFLKKLSGSATEYMDGSGNWSTPAGGSSGHKFRVYKSASQANSTSLAKVTFDSETFDTGGNFASSTFTAPATGYYEFIVRLNATSGTTSDNQVFAYLYKNGLVGTEIGRAASFGTNSGDTESAHIHEVVHLNAGDTVEVYWVATSASSTIEGGASNTVFIGKQL